MENDYINDPPADATIMGKYTKDEVERKMKVCKNGCCCVVVGQEDFGNMMLPKYWRVLDKDKGGNMKEMLRYYLAPKGPDVSWWTAFLCRLKGHKCGIIFYNDSDSLEPDYHCKNCHDYLG